MQVSIATATFYFLPFEQTLEMIAAAGFEHVELDLYWERDAWAMAQHLQDVPVHRAVDMIHRAGLHVSSIHDGGGVLHHAHSIQGFVNPQLEAYLDQLGYAPGCIVFHTPHIKGSYDQRWWQSVATEIAQAAVQYQSSETSVTLENMPFADGYYVPLTSPEELLAFVSQNGLGVTLDTTHYPQMGMDLIQATGVLRNQIKTLHLSDYADGKTHVFIGEGELDWNGLFRALDLTSLHSIALECSVGLSGQDEQHMTQTERVDRLKIALERLQSWIKVAEQSR